MSNTKTLREQISASIVQAMKERDTIPLATLRMLKTAITNKDVELGRDIDDAEILRVVGTLVKQRRDSMEQFGSAGRSDLADREEAEIAVLEKYLPPAATESDIERAVAEAIAETQAASPKDMGKVMKSVMPKLAGKTANGRDVSEAVRRALAAT